MPDRRTLGLVTEPRNPELERVICANPEEREPYLVLADWLEQQGHPRAELIRLQAEARRKPTKPERVLMAQHREALIGSTGRFAAPKWRNGFIHSVHVGAPRFLPALLDHPSGRLVVALALGEATDEALARIATDARALRELSVTATAAVSLASLGERLAALTSCRITGPVSLAGSAMPRLIVLAIHRNDDASRELGVVIATMPEHLEQLEIDAPVGREVAVAAVRAAPPTLRRLDCRTAANQICASLATTPSAQALEHLIFRESDLTNEGLEALIEHRAALPALRSVDAHGCSIDLEVATVLNDLEVEVYADRYDDIDE